MKHTAYLAALALVLYMGLHNGYLALWQTGAPDPVTVFPYRAALYPKIDQAALNEGIPIQTPAHLKQLLEDFLS